jgi:hypothetical protein
MTLKKKDKAPICIKFSNYNSFLYHPWIPTHPVPCLSRCASCWQMIWATPEARAMQTSLLSSISPRKRVASPKAGTVSVPCWHHKLGEKSLGRQRVQLPWKDKGSLEAEWARQARALAMDSLGASQVLLGVPPVLTLGPLQHRALHSAQCTEQSCVHYKTVECGWNILNSQI